MSKEIKEEISTDLWSYLSASNKTIVMYGMGNGAEKILAVCAKHNITISDFFASDGFVRGHSFHGKVVLSYSDIKEKYKADDIIVLLSFASSLDNVIDNIKRIDDEVELYAPDVPVFGDEIFDLKYYLENEEKFDKARKILSDSESRRIFDNIIRYKLTGKISYLFDAQSSEEEMFSILGAKSFRTIADLGAYTGDTIRKIEHYSPDLSCAYALEPDEKNFKKLLLYAKDKENTQIKIIPINKGAWSCEKAAYFDASGNRNAGVADNASSFTATGSKRKIKEIRLDSLDSVLNNNPVDYIKYDVEGSEKEALLGSVNTIQKYSPSLLVSAYHRSGDLADLPLMIRELNPEYRIYLRRLKYIPAWDINLLAVK